MNSKPTAALTLDHRGRTHFHIQVDPSTLTSIRHCLVECEFRGNQSEFTELLLKRGVAAVRAERGAGSLERLIGG